MDFPNRAQAKDQDFANKAIACLWRVVPVEGLGWIDGKFAKVTNDSPRAEKQPKRPAGGLVSGDRDVALLKALITVLALAGVVKQLVVDPSVPVPVLAAGRWVGEEKYIRGLT